MHRKGVRVVAGFSRFGDVVHVFRGGAAQSVAGWI
jgi:hypothetical protein